MGPAQEICEGCKKRVFLMQRINVEGHVFHRSCFSCCRCSKTLQTGAYEYDDLGDKFYCSPHYREYLRQLSIKRTMSARGIRSFEDGDGSLKRKKKTNIPSYAEDMSTASTVRGESHSGSNSPTTSGASQNDQVKQDLPKMLAALAQKKKNSRPIPPPPVQTSLLTSHTAPKREPPPKPKRPPSQSFSTPQLMAELTSTSKFPPKSPNHPPKKPPPPFASSDHSRPTGKPEKTDQKREKPLEDVHEEKEIEQSSITSIDPTMSVTLWRKKDNKSSVSVDIPSPATRQKPTDGKMRRFQSDASELRYSVSRKNKPELPAPFVSSKKPERPSDANNKPEVSKPPKQPKLPPEHHYEVLSTGFDSEKEEGKSRPEGDGLWIRDTVMDHYEFSSDLNQSQDKVLAPLGELLPTHEEEEEAGHYEVPIKKPPSKPPRRQKKIKSSVENQLTDRESWGDPYAVTPVTDSQRQEKGGREKEMLASQPPSRPAPPPPYEGSTLTSPPRPLVSPYAVSQPNLPGNPSRSSGEYHMTIGHLLTAQ